MRINEKSFISSDEENIFYYEFLPDDGNVKFILQVVHGMGEHSGRYKTFAEFMTGKGAVVYISDHRAHGKNVKNIEDYGVWPDKNTWFKIVDDIKILSKIAKKNYTNKPNFILGHSVGSFMVRTLIIDYGNYLDGVILTGTGTYSNYYLRTIKLIIHAIILLKGSDHKSEFLYNVGFGSFNKWHKIPNQWLTHDQKIVEEYNKDPYAGGIMSNSFYLCLTKGALYINQPVNTAKIRKDLPLSFFSGTGDPVGKSTKGVQMAADSYIKAGLKNIEIKLYDGGRHEMLNEINKEEVFNDIYLWIINIMENK